MDSFLLPPSIITADSGTMGTHLRRPGRLWLTMVNVQLANSGRKPAMRRLRIRSYWTRLQLFVSRGGPARCGLHFPGHDQASRLLAWVPNPQRQLANDGRLKCADRAFAAAEMRSQAE